MTVSLKFAEALEVKGPSSFFAAFPYSVSQWVTKDTSASRNSVCLFHLARSVLSKLARLSILHEHSVEYRRCPHWCDMRPIISYDREGSRPRTEVRIHPSIYPSMIQHPSWHACQLCSLPACCKLLVWKIASMHFSCASCVPIIGHPLTYWVFWETTIAPVFLD